MTSVHSRKILIIGAAGSIGDAVAQAFATPTSDLVLSDLSAPADMAALVAKAGSCRFIRTDLSQPKSIEALFDSLGSRLDVLVNAAGIVSKGPSNQISENEWDRVIAVNLKSVFLTCQKALSLMAPHKSGRVVNIGSVIAQNGGNARSWLLPEEQLSSSNAAYAASKAGVHALTAYLGREYARFGVTVNAIAPGPIATSMIANYPQALIDLIPVRRLGTPEEVADAVLFLASTQAGFINGATLDMNGGLHIR